MSNTERTVAMLGENLKDIPTNMRIFSLCMRSLYSDKAIGSGSNTAIKVNKLRDDTKRDALVYVKGILPISTQVVRSIKEFFEYYEELSMEDWKENLTDILEEVQGYKQCCTEVVRLHEDIMIPLKRRQDEAKVLVKEIEELSKVYERKKRELEDSASTKKGWAFALAFVPGVNVIASPLLSMSADSDLANAIANGVQCDINNATVLVVSETMIPALAAFIDGLNATAGFFSFMEQELISFQGKGEKAKDNAKKLHYTMMRKKATEIKGSCAEFYAMIPGVRTDFMCIPDMNTDQNYVDRWLKKQEDEIRKKYSNSLTGGVRKMLSLFSKANAERAMIEEKK